MPSKKASLNSNELVPKSTSLLVTGANAPSTSLIWSAPDALNKIVLSVAKSISLSESLPITKLVFKTDVTPVTVAVHSGADAPEFTCNILPAVPIPSLDN